MPTLTAVLVLIFIQTILFGATLRGFERQLAIRENLNAKQPGV